jgi:hypothetical protein
MPGSKPGERRGGRQPGTKNKRTVERERSQAEVSAQITNALGPGAFKGDAHSLLVSVYKNPAHPIGLRLDAAKAALPFEKPRLSAINAKVEGGVTLEQLIIRSYEREAERK